MEPDRALEPLRAMESTLWRERSRLHPLHFGLVTTSVDPATDGGIDRLITALLTLGAAASSIESVELGNAGDVVERQGGLGEVEEIDLSEALIERERAYQAALAAFSRTSQPSLLDFLA